MHVINWDLYTICVCEQPSSNVVLLKQKDKSHVVTTVKTCVKRPLKIDKANSLMTNGSLMVGKSIAECSYYAILFTGIKAINAIETNFLSF